MDWSIIFDEMHSEPGADDSDIAALIESLRAPLTDAEIDEIETEQRSLPGKRSPEEDPRTWTLPDNPLPETYLAFLRWSNGGQFRKGERWFDPVFPTGDVRAYMLNYNLPGHIPGSVPFAFDGSGTFYLFDMRQNAVNGEYPIIAAHAGAPWYGSAVHIASSFVDACNGTVHPMDIK